MTSRFCRRTVLLGLLACFSLLFASSVRAQEYRGSVSGTVTDPTGAAVPSAKVTARNNATNTATTVGTTDQGAYTILALDPGTYTVTVEANGFKTLARNNIEVRAGIRLGLDLALEVGNISQTVTVTSEACPSRRSRIARSSSACLQVTTTTHPYRLTNPEICSPNRWRKVSKERGSPCSKISVFPGRRK